MIKTTAGYSGTPLAKKLGFKEGFIVKIINEPENYWDLLYDLPKIQLVSIAEQKADLIHLFSMDSDEMYKSLLTLKTQITPNGMIWVSWPKKASKIQTDITEDLIRNFALKNGLVDIKVCAIDDVWSGLKLVIPVKERTAVLN